MITVLGFGEAYGEAIGNIILSRVADDEERAALMMLIDQHYATLCELLEVDRLALAMRILPPEMYESLMDAIRELGGDTAEVDKIMDLAYDHRDSFQDSTLTPAQMTETFTRATAHTFDWLAAQVSNTSYKQAERIKQRFSELFFAVYISICLELEIDAKDAMIEALAERLTGYIQFTLRDGE